MPAPAAATAARARSAAPSGLQRAAQHGKELCILSERYENSNRHSVSATPLPSVFECAAEAAVSGCSLTRPSAVSPCPALACLALARARPGYCKFSNRCRYQHIADEFNTVQRPKPQLNDDDPYGHASAAFGLPAGQLVPVAALLAFEQQRALQREREQSARVARLESELAAMRQVVHQQSVHIEVAQRQQQQQHQGGHHALFQRKADNKSRNAAKKFRRNQRAQTQWTEQEQHTNGAAAAAAAAPEETQFCFEQRGADCSPWPQRRAEHHDAVSAFAAPQALLPTPRRQTLLPTPPAAAYSNGNGHGNGHSHAAAAAAASSGVNGGAPQLRVRTKLSGQKRAHGRDDDDANDNSTSVEVFSRMPLQLSQLSQRGNARRLPPVPTHTQQAELIAAAPSAFAFNDVRPMDLKTEAGMESSGAAAADAGDVMSECPAASTRSTRSRTRAQR